ncbi:MAG TPA: hypothetical protein VFV28_08180 [Limnobacter sp.]|nr:hypothetical protein [Limnobacter sp.]
MSIELKEQTAHLIDTVAVEEAEQLMSLALENPGLEVDLGQCSHLHAAALQVLMALKPTIREWPVDAELTQWLKAAIEKTWEK